MLYRVNKIINNDDIVFIHIPRTGGTLLSINALNINSYSHTPIKLISQKIKGNKTFCVVRNPYERFYSACKYANIDNIEAFTESILNSVDWIGDYDISHIEHFFTQCHFVLKDGKVSIDYIFKYEYFDDNIKNLKSKGVRFKEGFKYRVSKSSNWNQVLTDKTKRNIEIIYRDDFKQFDYKTL